MRSPPGGGGATVTRIDWDVMLAGLEQQRTGLAQELADVDAVIATVRQRAAPSVRVADITTPRGNGTKGKRAAKSKTDRHGQGGKIDDAVLAPMRKQYEAGVAVDAIAKGSGRSIDVIYYYAKSRKWKRPNPGAAAKSAAAAPTPKGEPLSGNVRCPNPACGQWTAFDPCQSCGKKLNRKGW